MTLSRRSRAAPGSSSTRPIFLHHFAGTSPQCRTLLERCERSEVRGATSALVLAEVAHRLMCLEAVAQGLVSPGQVARKLRERPEVAQKLQAHEEATAQIPLMGVEVLPLDLRVLLAARGVAAPRGATGERVPRGRGRPRSRDRRGGLRRGRPGARRRPETL